MHGILNGIRLNRITTIKSASREDGSTWQTVRVMEPLSADLEAELQPNCAVRLITSDGEIEGRLVGLSADSNGYEITIRVGEP